MKTLIFLAFALALTACGTDPSSPGKIDDEDVGIDSENNMLCEDGDTSTSLCGVNDRGTQNLSCEDGQFVPSGDCEDPDECTDGDETTETCGTDGLQNRTCEAGQWVNVGSCEEQTTTCVDGDTRELPCGVNGQGTQNQICNDNTWSNDGVCADPDECVNGEEQTVACGLEDSGDQNQICENGAWVDVGECEGTAACADDDTQDITCGLNDNGTQAQLCVVGEWTNQGDCADPDVCANTTTQVSACGLNQNGEIDQVCTNGQWVDDGTCVDPDTCTNGDDQTVICGLNDRGTQSQDCTAGQWVDNGACNDPDECMDGVTETITCGINGELERVCETGSWNNGTCIEVCVENDTRTLDCGLNDRGEQSQVCTAGNWLDDGACIDPDVCVDDALQTLEDACGLNNRGDQNQICTLGAWADDGACADPDECTDSDTQILADTCGLNGRGGQGQVCTLGSWVDDGSCVDLDECTDAETQVLTDSCGFNNRGDQNQVCTLGTWTDETCVDPDICLDGATSSIDCEGTNEDRTCVSGQWSVPTGTHVAMSGACEYNRQILTCWIQHPATITQNDDDTETVFGRLTTDNDVASADGLLGVQAQLCYGDATDPFSSDDIEVCLPATWNPTPLGGGNEYQTDLMLPGGDHRYVYSFSGDGGATWVYCGTGENSASIAEGATIAQPGEAEIVDLCPLADLALFTFETSVPTTAGPHVAEEGANASSSFILGFHASASASYTNPAGSGSGESFSSNNWQVDDYYQVQVPTTGRYGVQISWDQQRSSSGPGAFKLEWSPDGTTFTTVSDYQIVSTSYESFSFELPSGADNLANVWVRFTSREAGTTTSGTNRIDNIAVAGSICVP